MLLGGRAGNLRRDDRPADRRRPTDQAREQPLCAPEQIAHGELAYRVGDLAPDRLEQPPRRVLEPLLPVVFQRRKEQVREEPVGGQRELAHDPLAVAAERLQLVARVPEALGDAREHVRPLRLALAKVRAPDRFLELDEIPPALRDLDPARVARERRLLEFDFRLTQAEPLSRAGHAQLKRVPVAEAQPLDRRQDANPLLLDA
jgi:hypothetical protein